MGHCRIASLILVNGPPGVGKSTIARRLRDDRPRSLLVDFDSAACHEIVLTGDPERVAAQFRQRRAERTLAGEDDVSSNISDDRLDEVIAWAIEELTALAAARPHTAVISTDGGVDSTYMRVREVLQRDASG
ncbi:MAG: hypothetical protein V7636_2292 [Actinomycetota bacterium]|jgi:phage terminase large subunit-like protein